MLGATVGIPGSLASIMRNLAMVLDTEKAVIMRTTSQRRKQLIIDFIFSFGFPIYMMAIHYVVQPSRYYIFAIAGCVVSFDDSWPTVVLMWIWPSVLSLVGVFYSGMCTRQTLSPSKLIFASIGGHAHAQVSPGVFRYPRLDRFQTYQVSIQAIILDGRDAHNNCTARPILYPFPKCILSLCALWLERHSRAILAKYYHGAHRRCGILWSVDSHCNRLGYVFLLRSRGRGYQNVPRMATCLGFW